MDIRRLGILIGLITFTFMVKGQDNIAPIITSPARDTSFTCGTTNGLIEKLTVWYNGHAGAMATDNSDTVIFQANLTLLQTITIFNNSLDVICGNKQSVTVIFTALDPSGNISLPTTASFFTTDNSGPTINNVQSVQYNCVEGIRDTLIKWIQNKAGYVATDACSNSVTWTDFLFSISNGNTQISSGLGKIISGPYPMIPNGICNWTLNINFFVRDECGNETITPATTTFKVIDNVSPFFINPPLDITVDCDKVPVPSIKAEDYCDRNIIPTLEQISTRNIDTTLCSHYNYLITRKWTATDKCGNAISHTQTIEVIDTLKPTIIQRPLVNIDCDIYENTKDSLYITFSDNCSDVNVTFKDSLLSKGCASTFLRSHFLTDRCGNLTKYQQTLKILQNQKPIITKHAKNEEFICTSQDDFNARLAQWVQNRGGSEASPICGDLNYFAALKGSYDLSDTSTFPGTNPVILPLQSCPSGLDGYLRYLEVDFVYYDSCSNAISTSGVFGVIDRNPPVIQNCPGPIELFTDSLSCVVMTKVTIPTSLDDCIEATSPIVRKIIAVATSTDPPGQESIIDPVDIKIGPFNPAISNPLSDGLVQIKLLNMDIDDNTEFFNIFDEDGNNIGTSPVGVGQCASTTFTIMLDKNKIANWIKDGFIELRFVPNVAAGGLSINNICGGSTIEVIISYEIDLANTVNKFYSLDGNERVKIDSSKTVDLELTKGNHSLTFYMQDCANNVSECTVPIKVLDRFSPTIICPSNLVSVLSTGVCKDTILLPVDFKVIENCEGNRKYKKTSPSSIEASRISFLINSSTNLFEARSKQIVFTEVFPIRHTEGQVDLEVEFYGDNGQDGEYYEIFGPNGYLLGRTNLTNLIACGISKTLFKINKSVFNTWIVNNQITLLAVPKNGGDGINPCILLSTGQTLDNLSYIKATLAYSDASFTVSIGGATILNETPITPGLLEIPLILNGGNNILTLRTSDGSGNLSSCNFQVMVKDMEKPIARCKNIVITVEPSGLLPTSITPGMINNGSSDNCKIASLKVIPDQINCSSANTDVNAQLIVIDVAGNADTCATLIKVKPFELTPSFSAGLCSNDTLKLFSNLPAASVPGTYTFHWKGPGNIEFFTENPSIPSADESYNGAYILTVTGFNNCVSVGTVTVNIKPLTNPILTSSEKDICEDDEVILSTTNYSGDIDYQWYEGIFPTGVLLNSTKSPELILKPTNLQSSVLEAHFYYVIAKGPDCSSNASPLLKISVYSKVDSKVNDIFLSPCEGDKIVLGSSVNNSKFTYHWTGPSGYNETGVNPRVINNASVVNTGDYQLVIKNGVCISDTAVTRVEIFERPAKPTIVASDIFCEGTIFSMVAISSPTAEKYEWYRNSDLYTITQDNSLILPNALSSLQGTWTVLAVKGNCKSLISASKFIAIDNSLQIGVINSGPVCMGDSVKLQATFVPNATYTWSGPFSNIPDTYNPHIPGIAGDYSVTITTPTGCLNSGNTNVSVIEVPKITALSNDAKPCMDKSEIIKFALSVFPNSDTYTYSWTGPNGYLSNSKSPILQNINPLDTGKYTLVIFNNGCPSSAVSTLVKFYIIPDQPSLTSIGNFCEGDSIVITSVVGKQGAEYIWTTPLGKITQTSNIFKLPVANKVNAGKYSVQIKVNECISKPSGDIEIIVKDKPEKPELFSNSPVCFGDTIRISTREYLGGSYEWKSPNNVLGSNNMFFIANANKGDNGDYYLKVNVNGCISESSEKLNIKVFDQIKTPEFVLPSISLCKNSTNGVELCLQSSTLNPGAVYQIYDTSSENLLIQGNSSCFFLIEIASLIEGANFLIAKAVVGNCTSNTSQPIVLNINTPPNLKARAIEDNIKICPSEIVRLISVDGPPLVNVKWTTLDNDIVISDRSSISPTLSGMKPGSNTIYLDYSIEGCLDFSRDTINIYVEFEPKAEDDNFILAYGDKGIFDILANDNIPIGSSLKLTSQPAHGIVEISSSKLIFTPDTRFLEPQIFVYEVCGDYCPDLCDEAFVRVTFDDNISCKAPNIFTPNQDNINDYFVIPCLETERFPQNKVMIFNEWGQEVFFASPYKNDWDGTFGGNTLPVGTYFYVIDTGDGQQPINGFLILQR